MVIFVLQGEGRRMVCFKPANALGGCREPRGLRSLERLRKQLRNPMKDVVVYIC